MTQLLRSFGSGGSEAISPGINMGYIGLMYLNFRIILVLIVSEYYPWVPHLASGVD